jgi:hypothetical protein
MVHVNMVFVNRTTTELFKIKMNKEVEKVKEIWKCLILHKNAHYYYLFLYLLFGTMPLLFSFPLPTQPHLGFSG